MNSGLSPEPNIGSSITSASPKSKSFKSSFRAIPPERVGLNGEYDHYGLVKRVALAFNQTLSPEDVASLKIRQRGGVVILMGKVASQRLLTRMIHIALRVDGATDVETLGVCIEPARETCREVTQPISVGLQLLDFARSI